jgi:hypothetical protein
MTMRTLFCLVVLLHAVFDARAQTAQSQYVTLQARLVHNGEPVDGPRDLSFVLYSAATGGTQLSGAYPTPAWPVVDGLFTVELPFTNAVAGSQVWIEVRVDGTPVLPRLQIAAAPIAQFALSGTEGPQGPPGPQGDPGLPGEGRRLSNARCPPDQMIDVIATGGAECRAQGLRNWRRVGSDFAVANLAIEQRTVSCQPGEVVLGGGVEQLGRSRFGDAAGIEVRIVESFPTFANGVWAWQVAVYNTGLVVSLRAFATCAKP